LRGQFQYPTSASRARELDKITVGELADRSAIHMTEDCDLSEALRLLVLEGGAQMLLVTDDAGALQGIVTKTDILRAVKMSSEAPRDH